MFAASTRQIQGSVLNRQFAFCGGGFSLWLCLDDMFLVSVVLLGLSVLTDALQGLWPNSYETVQIFEEGFKFLGIAAWLSFWCHYVSSASKPAALEQH